MSYLIRSARTVLRDTWWGWGLSITIASVLAGWAGIAAFQGSANLLDQIPQAIGVLTVVILSLVGRFLIRIYQDARQCDSWRAEDARAIRNSVVKSRQRVAVKRYEERRAAAIVRMSFTNASVFDLEADEGPEPESRVTCNGSDIGGKIAVLDPLPGLKRGKTQSMGIEIAIPEDMATDCMINGRNLEFDLSRLGWGFHSVENARIADLLPMEQFTVTTRHFPSDWGPNVRAGV